MTVTTPPEPASSPTPATTAGLGGTAALRRRAKRVRRRQPGLAATTRQLLRPRYQFPLLLLVTALALTFAWQVRAPLALTIGGPDDTPYLAGFNDGEAVQGSDQRFRWTRDRATITLPGFGATDANLTLTLQGNRPGGTPVTALGVTLGDGARQTLPLSPELRDYTLAVPASAFRDGTLIVTLDTPTYRPSGDRRDLGVVVAAASLRDTGSNGLIVPPLRTLGLALLAVLCAYGAFALALRAPLAGALAGWPTALAFLLCALGPRDMLTLYAPALTLLIGVTTLAVLALAAALIWLGHGCGWASGERALGGLTLIGGVHVLALLIGMRHPQFRSSDLLLNVHRLEFVQHGEWVFTLALPGARALEAPYPPLFYATMLPFSWFIADKALLVEVFAALACVVGTLLTFALARRVCGEDGPALWAAAVCAVVPITYGLASAGNFANLFGQGVATAYLVALVLTWGHWRRPFVAATLTVGLTLAFLGHFGVFLSLLVAIPLLVIVLIARGGTTMHGQALALLGSFAVALVLSWAIYYHFHNDLLFGHVSSFLGGDTNARGGAADVTLGQRLRNEWNGLLIWWGWPALPLALVGINLLRRARGGPQLTLALTWLGTALPFLALAVIAGLSVRFHLFAAPALGVVVGWALWRFWQLHRFVGPAICLALSVLWVWQSMNYWADRVLHAYH